MNYEDKPRGKYVDLAAANAFLEEPKCRKHGSEIEDSLEKPLFRPAMIEGPAKASKIERHHRVSQIS